MSKKVINKNEKNTKRAKSISMQQQIMILAIIISALIGFTVMLLNHNIKIISFNNQIIDAKNEAIDAYNKTIKNVGICKDYNNDGKFDEIEIKRCSPDDIRADEIPDSLRYNVLHQTASNADLESVGRESLSLCYDDDGKRINYNQKHAEASTEKEKTLYMDLSKKCSAIRAIPDALPSKDNTEALLSSLHKIMILSSWEPEKISPDGEVVPVDIPGLGFMPLKFGIEANPSIIHGIIGNIERSIRNIDINKATFTWGNKGKIDFAAHATAYYAEQESYQEKTTTITPKSGNSKSKTPSKSNSKARKKK